MADRVLSWIAAIACGLALLVMVASVTLDRVLASPAGVGWSKPALARAVAGSVGLGLVFDFLAPEPDQECVPCPDAAASRSSNCSS